MKVKTVSLETFKKHDFCTLSRNWFRKNYGKDAKVRITLKNLGKAWDLLMKRKKSFSGFEFNQNDTLNIKLKLVNIFDDFIILSEIVEPDYMNFMKLLNDKISSYDIWNRNLTEKSIEKIKKSFLTYWFKLYEKNNK